MKYRFIGFCNKAKVNLRGVRLTLIAFLFMELLSIGYTSYMLYLLSGQPTAVKGIITNVYRDGHSLHAGYIIELDDIEYELTKRSFSQRTYGIRDHMDIVSYGQVLKQRIGSQARIEYIQLAPNTRIIMRLTINEKEYLITSVTHNDHIAEQVNILYTAMVLLILTVSTLIFVSTCIKSESEGSRDDQKTIPRF